MSVPGTMLAGREGSGWRQGETMTETTPQYYAPGPPPAPPVQLNPAGTTDLGRLLDRLAAAKAAVAEAEAERDAIIADIKAQGVRAATALNGGTAPEHIRF